MYICPICGYDKLIEEAYDYDGNPSYEICNCCGFEFGFDDIEVISFEIYREIWMKKGTPWYNLKAKPMNWDFKKQVANLNKN